MENNKHLYSILVLVLSIGVIFFGFAYFSAASKLKNIESTQAQAVVNEKVLDFALMFVRQVLQAEREVDFETRLSLENAVRDLKDEEIRAEWQNFTESNTELEAQNSVKKLLEILLVKIQK